MNRLLFLFGCWVGTAACGEHEPELERRGGPMPEIDSGAMPAEDPMIDAGTITWCQTSRVLETVCQRCHSDPPQNFAPFPLVTYADTQAPYYTSDTPIWEVMGEAVSSGFMPLMSRSIMPPVEPLTCEEKTTLLAWVQQGAKLVGPETCGEADKTLAECDTSIEGVGAGGNGG